MDYLSVQLNTEVSPEGIVCLLEPFKMLFKMNLSYIRKKLKKKGRATVIFVVMSVVGLTFEKRKE